MVKLLSKDLEENAAFIIAEGRTEFENYAMALTPAGRMTYSAPEGEHDDVVAAKMLQHWGLINEGVPEVQMLTADAGGEIDTREPWEVDHDDDGNSWDDLLDEPDMTVQEAAMAIGMDDPYRQPTPQELLHRPDVWFG
jgi:hypothetical protein